MTQPTQPTPPTPPFPPPGPWGPKARPPSAGGYGVLGAPSIARAELLATPPQPCGHCGVSLADAAEVVIGGDGRHYCRISHAEEATQLGPWHKPCGCGALLGDYCDCARMAAEAANVPVIYIGAWS